MLKDIKHLLQNVIKNTEFEDCAYFAGGCVRDELLGRQTNDIDITVELPDGGIRLAALLHEQAHTTKPIIYKQFGTALVILKDYKIELVMTRKESYRTKSRKPDVAFGTVLEDVLRRDFTINSLLMRVSDGEILDLSGFGLSDIESRLIRSTAEPEIMFKEDPLRIMRAVRFAATLNFNIEKTTQAVLIKMIPMLKHISKERKAEEFLKIINSDSFISGMQLLSKTGIIKEILPNLVIPSQFSEIDTDIRFSENIMKLSKHARCALLLWRHEDPSPILDMLKLSQKDIERITKLTDCCKTIRYLQKSNPVLTDVQLRKKAYWYKDIIDEVIEFFPLTGLLQKEDNSENDRNMCVRLKQEAVLLDENRFNLTGDDLIRTFCSENGVWVGEMLKAAREYWFEHPLAENTELIQYLKELSNAKDNKIN